MTKHPERTHYFAGQLLSTTDFEREQQYFRDRLRRHNRYAHGWGVLDGLQVEIVGHEVQVSPGLAIDCAGNELEIIEQQRITIGNLAEPFFVGIKFLEIPATPVLDPAGQQNYATIIESAEIELSLINAGIGHTHPGPGCGQCHAIVLAHAKLHNGIWHCK